MSIKLICWAFEQELKPTEKLVLIKLADCANDDGICWPSQTTIARHTSLTRETVNRSIRRLIDMGLVESHQTHQEGKITGCRYRLGPSLDVVTERHYGCDGASQGGVTERHREPSDGTVKTPIARGRECVPVDELIEAYHKAAPRLLRAVPNRFKGSQGHTHLRKRWEEDEAHRSVEWWAQFFAVANENPTWNGENERGWVADLAWLVRRTNFDKVVTRWANRGRLNHVR